MYTLKQYNSLQEAADPNHISLKLLQDYYKTYLMPYTFYFEMESNVHSVEEVNLEFSKSNFCHLISIASMAEYAGISDDALQEFKGSKGWKNIEDERILMEDLKKIAKRKYEDYKQEFELFHLCEDLLLKGECVHFDSRKLPKSRLRSSYLFYGQLKDSLIILGIDKDEEGYYYPRTFFIEDLKRNNGKSYYISNQEPVCILTRRKDVK